MQASQPSGLDVLPTPILQVLDTVLHLHLGGFKDVLVIPNVTSQVGAENISSLQ